MAVTEEKSLDPIERAKELYYGRIEDELTDDQLGLYLAIDLHSRDYEVGGSRIETRRALRTRRPHARIFGMLHGSVTVGSIGYVPPKPGSWSLVE